MAEESMVKRPGPHNSKMRQPLTVGCEVYHPGSCDSQGLVILVPISKDGLAMMRTAPRAVLMVGLSVVGMIPGTNVREGVRDGVGVIVGVLVAVGVIVTVAVSVRVGVAVLVGVAVRVGVEVIVGVFVIVGVVVAVGSRLVME